MSVEYPDAGRRGIWARIAADGSTARIARSNQSLNATANAPVPAPMSTTVMRGDGLRCRRTASRHAPSPSRGTSRTALYAAAVWPS
jgi:hypothetical protein